MSLLNLGDQTFYLVRNMFFFSLFITIDVSACVQCICGIRLCELFFLIFNALTERTCEPRVVVPEPSCLWSYLVYQHMFTELQEHARARFMKNNSKIRYNFSSV